jgi:hypothetical protein
VSRKPLTVYLPSRTREVLERRASEERRSVSRTAELLLEGALGGVVEEQVHESPEPDPTPPEEPPPAARTQGAPKSGGDDVLSAIRARLERERADRG